MSEYLLHNLILDEELLRIFQPLPEQQYEEVVDKILNRDTLPPLLVWNHMLIDGFDEYKIYHELSLPFYIEEANFHTRTEVIEYLCERMITRGFLTDERTRYCVGKLYHAEKNILLEKFPVQNQYTPEEYRRKDTHSSRHVVHQKIKDYLQVSLGTIYKYGTYADAVDEICSKAPAIGMALLNGEFVISHNNTLELCRLSSEEIQVIYNHFKLHNNNHLLHSEMMRRVNLDKARAKKETQNLSAPEIKKMPKYDPDAEISSLSLTIPTWISSIKRTATITDLSKASTGALYKLEKQLIALRDEINSLQQEIQEEYHE